MKKRTLYLLLLFFLSSFAMYSDELFMLLKSLEKTPSDEAKQALNTKAVISCFMCLLNFTNDEELQNHFWAVHIEQPVTKCPECKQKFVWSFAITEHEKKAHPDCKKFQMQIIKPKNS